MAARDDERLDPIDRLASIEALCRLKARYFRFVDTQQWEALATLFSEDAQMDVRQDAGAEIGMVSGRRRIVAAIRSGLAGSVSIHHGHMPEFDFEGPSRARATWAMSDQVHFSGGRGFRGHGHYDDRYERSGGEWRITFMRLTRLRLRRRYPAWAGRYDKVERAARDWLRRRVRRKTKPDGDKPADRPAP